MTTPAPWEVEIDAPLETAPSPAVDTESPPTARGIEVPQQGATRSPITGAASAPSAVKGRVNAREVKAAAVKEVVKGAAHGEEVTPVDSSLSIMTLEPRSRRFPALRVSLALAAATALLVMGFGIERGLFSPSSRAPLSEVRSVGTDSNDGQRLSADVALAVPDAPALSSTSLEVSSGPPAAMRAAPVTPAPDAGVAVVDRPPAAMHAAPVTPAPDAGMAVVNQPPAAMRAAPITPAPDAGIAVVNQPPAAPRAAPSVPAPAPDAGMAVADRPPAAPASSASGGAPAERAPSAQGQDGAPVIASPR